MQKGEFWTEGAKRAGATIRQLLATNFCNHFVSKSITFSWWDRTMNRIIATVMAIVAKLAVVTTLVAGCAATTPGEHSKAMTVNTAIEDFIAVEALAQTDVIRSMQELNYEVITDSYVIVSDRRASYLAKFRRRCVELYDSQVTPDIRRERHVLRAKTDSLRGCRIDSIYDVSDGQADELKSIGENSSK